MGWLYGWKSKQALVTHLSRPEQFGSCTLIENTVVGNCHWYLVEIQEDEGPRKVIGVDLMNGTPGDWGYKPLSEDMGPLEITCPLGYLEKADEPRSEAARKWR